MKIIEMIKYDLQYGTTFERGSCQNPTNGKFNLKDGA